MWHTRRNPSRRHHGDVYAYLMAFQTVVHFLQQRRTPPVTLALIAANVLVYFRPGPFNEILPYSREVCLNPAILLRSGDWRRFILSSFYHADDTHLIYNMISLLWKGMDLEAQQGSTRFAATTGALLLLCPSLYILVARLLSDAFDFHDPFYHECAIGFSSVLFGYKTILNASQPTYSSVGGILIPTKYAAWGELFLIQMLVPEASFLGHLCGILAGCILLYAPSFLRATLPFLPLGALLRNPFTSRRQWGSGQVGGGGMAPQHGPTVRRADDPFWACPACTFHNSRSSSQCEVCSSLPGDPMSSEHDRQEPYGHHEAPSAPPVEDIDISPAATSSSSGSYSTRGSGQQLTADEIRRRRLTRFQQH